MEFLKYNYKNDICILQLSRGRGNALSHQMVNEITQAAKDLEANGKVRGVIITGNPGIFSVGLDVLELYDFDQKQILTFWNDWQEMVKTLTAFSKPLICAISGHSPAGGCVIALCCDYRLMVEGEKFRIGLNEVAVGIELPGYIFEIAAFAMGTRKAYQNLMQGRLISVKEAYETHLIDEVCASENLMPRAEEVMQQWLKGSDNILQGSKRNMKKELLQRMQESFDESMDDKLAQWFHPDSRATMGKLVAQLKK